MRLIQNLQRFLTFGSRKPASKPHPHARELETISKILDDNPEIARRAHEDLTRNHSRDKGRTGMTGEQVLRVAVLKQMHEMSYRDIAFHLEDSASFHAFARLPPATRIKPNTLQSNIKRLQPKTWEEINRALLKYAQDKGIEDGRRIRTDCTGVESNIHDPTDSSLLCDCVRVVTRLLHRTQEKVPGAEIQFSDHTRRANRRAQSIDFPTKGKKREKRLRESYLGLLKVARKTYNYGRSAVVRLEAGNHAAATLLDSLVAKALAQELGGYLDSMARVIDQTERRVIRGEKVPASEKLVSIFETHTSIVVKGERETLFGHKICLTGGASSMILDCVIEDGNPTDSTMVARTIRSQIDIYGKPPRQASFDGGFASKANLKVAKDELGVQDVAFHKKRGLEVAEMVRSEWVYKKLRRFRAGIEGCIGTLKHTFAMERCTWRSRSGFHSYVWASVVSFNLLVMARHLIT